ncbi:MAG: hypothetical protein JO191_13865, partial [Mycobacteriaceae bacterium]|nr:hypothetical protein [Mycobacteriaceae bacterium]
MRAARWLPILLAASLMMACTTSPPDRHAQVDDLVRALRAMPGVVSARNTFSADPSRGPVFFEVDVDVADDVSDDQLTAITSTYLDDLRAQDYSRYRAEFDVRPRDNGDDQADNQYVVAGSGRSVNNRDQILAQARSWLALRRQFVGSSVALHAAVGHDDDPPGKPPVPAGSIGLPDSADYVAVGAAIDTLAARFADLAGGYWRVSAGTQHPAEIRTSRRLPTAQ